MRSTGKIPVSTSIRRFVVSETIFLPFVSFVRRENSASVSDVSTNSTSVVRWSDGMLIRSARVRIPGTLRPSDRLWSDRPGWRLSLSDGHKNDQR